MKALTAQFLTLILMMQGCSGDKTARYGLQLEWSLDSVKVSGEGSPATFATWRLTNTGSQPMRQQWEIYYNQLTGAPQDVEGLQFEWLSGTFYKVTPGPDFEPLMPGQSRPISTRYSQIIDRVTSAPTGVYAVFDSTVIVEVEDYTFSGIDTRVLSDLDLPDANSRYVENRKIAQDRPAEISVVPRPVSFTAAAGELAITANSAVYFPAELQSEGKRLLEFFADEMEIDLQVVSDPEGAQIVLLLSENLPGEGYALAVNQSRMVIAGDGPGVFYGIQTLKRLTRCAEAPGGGMKCTVPACEIEDKPRFGYRGLHFDVSRNFHTAGYVKRVIDIMALYKLNRLHLTLTNDEGWRLEIPGLPELTDVGSKRGHTYDERDRLHPAYGSGPFSEPGSAGTGYYSREKFIEILRYAAGRHIAVVPEIDLPGHARAAIKAMAARYERLLEAGDDDGAGTLLLHDPDDRSEYLSAQGYNDNVICVCRESTYTFAEKVVEELVSMYNEAGVPLHAIHSGGDELPFGAWQGSPVCQQFIAATDDVSDVNELGQYFQKRFIDILGKHGITSSAWEEIALDFNEEGHNTTRINDALLGDDVNLYVWNSVWGWGREDMAYKLANLGYDVIMCNSSALYFDLAYNRDPSEPGLTWSGVVDTKAAFDFIPFDIASSAATDIAGEPLSDEYLRGLVSLKQDSAQNILGIQGQLWGETLTSSELIDYYLVPKIMGLSERAWAWEPGKTYEDQDRERADDLREDWTRFAHTVGKIEMPMLDNILDGVKYRIPLPGAIVENGILYANIRYPGLRIRYTTDGSVPNSESALYEMPFEVRRGDTVMLRAFDSKGRSGRTTTVVAD